MIKRMNFNKITILIIFILLFIVSFFISIGNGAVKISPIEIINTLVNEKDSTAYQIILNVRLPRTIVAMFVGIGLSLSGTILQGVMRNPLASPNIIGVSSGGGFFAYVILILFPQYIYLVPMGAFIGALLASLFIYGLAWKDGVLTNRIILAGVAVSSIFSAGTNSLMNFFPERVQGVLGFMVGSLSAISWQNVRMIVPYTLLGLIILLFIPNKLNILMLGDEVATGLGLNVELTRFIFIILASLLAGAAVSVVGLLGFVGLIVPHMVRMFIGSDFVYLFPGTIFFGASVVMLCDTLARTLFAPIEIPVGIIMSVFGSPFFLYLLRKKKGVQ